MGDIERRCLVEFDPAGERICERREGHSGDHRGPLRGSERAKVYVELRNTRGEVTNLRGEIAALERARDFWRESFTHSRGR